MKIIKLGFISILAFAVVITLFSLLIPSHIRISKATDINAVREVIMVQVKDSANWKNWYPGADTVKVESAISAVTDSSVVINTKGRSESGFILYNPGIPGITTVQWYMDVHLRWYPWEKFSSLLLEKRYGPLMEQGLDKLKKYVTAK
ncbi:MAG: hypothetical protein IPM85_15440 [Chitinophagaceae bacterium]|nr:hypothetical protein [Chitinophagaceae bacterium]